MSTKNTFVFPGGKLRNVTVTATPGNVAFNASPGAGFRWVVISSYITLVADGNAANRYFRWEVTDGTAVKDIIGGGSTAVTAGQTKAGGFGPLILENLGVVITDVAARLVVYISKDNFPLEGADQVRITIKNGLVGDSYSGVVTVLEMKL